MYRYLLLSLVAATTGLSGFHTAAQDCDNAKTVTGTSYHGAAPEGYGHKLEFVGNSRSSGHYIEREHHTVWYKLPVTQNCELTIDIIPDQPHDDYDFMLFKVMSDSFCEDIIRKRTKPVRSNISRNHPAIGSRTGLSREAHMAHVHSGDGEPFSRSLSVRRGEVYILVLDNVYDNGGGHTINLSDCLGDQSDLPPAMIAEARKPYEPEVPEPAPTAEAIESPAEELAPSMAEELDQGHTFTLDKVYFFGNSAVAEMPSKAQLNELVQYMNAHPKISIVIHGHTNGQSHNNPYFRPKKNSEEYLFAVDDDDAFDGRKVKAFTGTAAKLSLLRAKTVKYYLVSQGIKNHRIDTKGWGDTKMIVAFTAENNYLNRRVEIEILN